MDAGYGARSELRTAVTALGLPYVAGILSTTTVWEPGSGPLPPKPYVRGRGRPTKRLRRDAAHRPVKVKDLLSAFPPRPGVASPGAREAMRRCDRASPGCAFAVPSATSSAANRGRKSGC